MLSSHLCVQELTSLDLHMYRVLSAFSLLFLLESYYSSLLSSMWIRWGIPWQCLVGHWMTRKWLFWSPHDTRCLVSWFLMKFWADEELRAPPHGTDDQPHCSPTVLLLGPHFLLLVSSPFLPRCLGSVLPLAFPLQLVWEQSSAGACREWSTPSWGKRHFDFFLRLCCLLLSSC